MPSALTFAIWLAHTRWSCLKVDATFTPKALQSEDNYIAPRIALEGKGDRQ